MVFRVSIVLSLVIAGAAALRASQPVPAPSAAWDSSATARFLDARMDLWWAKAKTLRTGAGETKCLSCHTAVPYALVRPALRQAQGVRTPTDHEERLLDIARRRVEHAGAEQLYYDHTEAKKAESLGVEAVLNALVLTSLESSTGVAEVMAHLWDVQRPDGAWNWLDFGLEPFESPDAAFQGATFAALAAGSESGARASRDANGQAGIERLRSFLRTNMASQRLFNRTHVLLASSRFRGLLTLAERNTLVRELVSRQRPDGGWSLADLGTWRWTRQEAPYAPPGAVDNALLAASDGYATGLVVYAMRQAGVQADDAAVVKGQQWLRAHQTPQRAGDDAWAPWRAHSLNFNREQGGERGESWRRLFMSDLATAFAALALL